MAANAGKNGGLEAEALAPVDCVAGDDDGLPVDRVAECVGLDPLVALPMDPVAGYVVLEVLVYLCAAEVHRVAGCTDFDAVVTENVALGFVVCQNEGWIRSAKAWRHFTRKQM